MTESNSPKFLATDDWFYICDQHGSYGSLDFCLQEVSNYITSEIEFDSFLLDLEFYEEHYNSLCQQEILKVRQKCLKLGKAGGQDWDIVHSSLMKEG